MAVFASDDFNGTVGATLTVWNPLWSPIPNFTSAVLQIQTTQAAGSYQYANYNYLAEPPSADYVVRATLRVNKLSTNGRLGLTARSSATEHTQYLVYMLAASSGGGVLGSINLLRYNNGVLTNLASTPFTLSAGDFAADLEVVGNRIRFLLDGVEIFDYVDDNPITGKGYAGIYQRNYFNRTDFLIDNFEAASLSAARKSRPLFLIPF